MDTQSLLQPTSLSTSVLNTSKPFYFLYFNKVCFIRFEDLYPECSVLIKDHPKISPFECFTSDTCPVAGNCLERIVRRMYFFTHSAVPETKVVGLVYKTPRNVPNPEMPEKWKNEKFMMVEFWLETSDLKVVHCANPFTYRYFLKRGKLFEYDPPVDFFLKY